MLTRLSCGLLVLALGVGQASAQSFPYQRASEAGIGSGVQAGPVVSNVSSIMGRGDDHVATPAPTAVGCDSGHCPTTCYTDCCPSRYLRVFAGWNVLENQRDIPFGTANQTMDVDFRTGWGMGGAIGKYMTPNLRRELETAYRHNSGDTASMNGNVMGDVDGNVRAYSGMGNLIYDFNQVPLAGFTPYIGGGIGVGVVEGNFSGGGENFTIDDTVFAYQGIAGVQRSLNCNVKMFAEYRFFGTDKVDVVGTNSTSRHNYAAHNVFLGFQFQR